MWIWRFRVLFPSTAWFSEMVSEITKQRGQLSGSSSAARCSGKAGARLRVRECALERRRDHQQLGQERQHLSVVRP